MLWLPPHWQSYIVARMRTHLSTTCPGRNASTDLWWPCYSRRTSWRRGCWSIWHSTDFLPVRWRTDRPETFDSLSRRNTLCATLCPCRWRRPWSEPKKKKKKKLYTNCLELKTVKQLPLWPIPVIATTRLVNKVLSWFHFTFLQWLHWGANLPS